MDTVIIGKVGKTAVSDIKQAPAVFTIAMAIIIACLVFLWDDASRNDIKQLSQQHEQMIQQIQLQTQTLEEMKQILIEIRDKVK